MADRILTTHVGSLPRSSDVTDVVFALERGEAVAPDRFSQVIGNAVSECVGKQVASGIDLVSDGEMSKISYATYIKDRITGFDGDSPRTPPAARTPTHPRGPRGAGRTRRRPRVVGLPGT